MLDEVARLGAPAGAALAVVGARALARLQLFRVLFPSWRFFDSAAPTPRLMVRTAQPGEPLGAYHDALPALPRRWSALFLNAEGNLRLAYHGLLERLVSDLAELDEGDAESARQLLSYELVVNLARASLRDVQPADRFQFKVQHVRGTAEPEDVLTSAVHPL